MRKVISLFLFLILFVFASQSFSTFAATIPPGCHSLGKSGECASVSTAFGVIDTNVPSLVKVVFSILLSFSGGVAILLIIVSGYELMASQGNPEKVKAARERLTSAIVGLIFIIFSIAILQFVGVTVLQLPGFGK